MRSTVIVALKQTLNPCHVEFSCIPLLLLCSVSGASVRPPAGHRARLHLPDGGGQHTAAGRRWRHHRADVDWRHAHTDLGGDGQRDHEAGAQRGGRGHQPHTSLHIQQRPG